MAKFRPYSHLKVEERNELLLEFCHALCAVRKQEEAAGFLRDLLSEQEIEMLAKRLKIARLLLSDVSYQKIQRQIDVSTGTIARVNAWLHAGGDGYRLVIARTKDRPLRRASAKMHAESESVHWKRRYSVYHWPELLLRDIIKAASKRQRGRLFATLEILKESKQKRRIFKELEQILLDPSNRLRTRL